MSTSEKPVVVVVGAGGEIGTAVRNSLQNDGFCVIGTQRRAQSSLETAKGDASELRHLDVTDSDSVTKFFKGIEETIGPPFGLVYVAGRMRDKPIALLSDAIWHDVIDVNLNGAFFCLRAAARPMMVAGRGRIVLVGSVSGRLGIPGQAAYAASKAAMEGLARVAAVEFGRYNITCNVVAPGAIDSGMFHAVPERAVQRTVQRTTLRRLGTPNEVAALIGVMLRPETAYVTGQTIVMDGGLTVS